MQQILKACPVFAYIISISKRNSGFLVIANKQVNLDDCIRAICWSDYATFNPSAVLTNIHIFKSCSVTFENEFNKFSILYEFGVKASLNGAFNTGF